MFDKPNLINSELTQAGNTNETTQFSFYVAESQMAWECSEASTNPLS